MRVLIDEDIPKELTAQFHMPGVIVEHVEDVGRKGLRNSDLLASISGIYDVFVTGDTNLGHQQNLRAFDLAVVLIHPPRLVIEQIEPLIPAVVAAFQTAPKHAVTTIGPQKARRPT